MSAFTRWRAGLRALLNRDALDRDPDREVHAWVDELAARYEGEGMSPQQARRRAVMETGGIEQVKARVRDVRVGNTVETTLGDVRYAWRGLRRTPAFALVTILTLGLGIGATTAIFSLVNALLLEELPFRDENTGTADMRAITPGLFETVGARLIEGRLFTEADDPRSIPVAIVDERFARRMWPGESALGKRIVADPHTSGKASVVTTVVGVVRHLRHRQPTLEVVEQIYVPARQAFRSPMAYLVKGATDAAVLVPQIRDVIQRLDPTVPIYDVRPLSVYVVNARADRRFTMVLAGAFAGVALVLAGIGVYGVTAYAVARRRRELGVRLAIGASRRQVVGLVIGESMQLAIAGLVLGLLGAGIAASLLRTQLFGITPADPVSYAVTVVTLTMAVALAAWLPARRATRVSPLESLRVE